MKPGEYSYFILQDLIIVVDGLHSKEIEEVR